ncbi:hypothetical protein AVEN_157639-1 [Araneus ventricosus]|uniref:Uncharacterized protein n=1 Tax=Araneus ventricosus TaxID=182803 RepID=A0A4Y2X9U7_ARAVE|nr:hypothetical protein AVEN_157639-1 [Araneus ventricosus]
MLAINSYDVAETKSIILQKSLKYRGNHTASSLELFNHIFDCYNTWTDCLQLVLGRKFPLGRNRAVIALELTIDIRSTKNEQQQQEGTCSKKFPTCPAFNSQILTESHQRTVGYLMNLGGQKSIL